MAIAELEGPAKGLESIARIADADRLRDYPFCAAALGELERRRGHRAVARGHFEQALGLARNAAEREFLGRRITECSD